MPKAKNHKLKAMLLMLKVIIQKQKLVNLILKVMELLLKTLLKLNQPMALNTPEHLMLKVFILMLAAQERTQKDILQMHLVLPLTLKVKALQLKEVLHMQKDIGVKQLKIFLTQKVWELKLKE